MKKKVKRRRSPLLLLIRPVILLVVFVAALWYFSGHYLTIRNFQLTTGEVEMAEGSMPYLTMLTNGQELNKLCGYTANLDWALNRETITPLTTDKTFIVKIFENNSTIRKFKYELYDVSTGKLLETNTINAITEGEFQDCEKSVKIKFTSDLARGTEYSVKFTLVTSESKRIYFYTRIKIYEKGYLDQKIDYVYWFRDSLINKENQSLIEKNLETKSNADKTDFAHVDINSNWTMVSWGSMHPEIVETQPPVITDFYEEYASIVLNYVVKVENGTEISYMKVSETFRMLYTTIRTYLYTYDRVTETIYDVANTYLYSSDLKLGITNDTGMQIRITSNYKHTAFVHNGELWNYETSGNKLIKVFSFRDDNNPYALDTTLDDHEIKILKQDSKGNLDFAVYGYMNRGEYEGRVGIVFYHFDITDNRITELAYIPVNTTYQLLKGEITNLIYRSGLDILYFALYDTVYSYNITTGKLTAIAENVPEGHFAFISAENKIIWQDNPDDSSSSRLIIMDLESGASNTRYAADGEVICMFGGIDDNVIIGYAKKADICKNADGSTTVPMYKIVISDIKGNELKVYEPENCYVTDVRVKNNMIIFDRVKKRDSETLSYVSIDSDGLSDRVSSVTLAASVISRSSTTMKKEYYLAFPSIVSMAEVPTTSTVPFTIITKDQTIMVNAGEDVQEFYRTYSFGQVVIRTSNVAEAIALADSDEGIGAVIDSSGRLVWERGVKSTKNSISGIKPAKAGELTSLQQCLKLLFKYEGYDVDTSQLDFTSTDIPTVMKSYIKVSPVVLKGVTLDQMLYYVYKKRPVIAIIGDGQAILITGYDSSNIEYIDTASGKTVKITKEKAESLFAQNGNTFYCYVK